VTASVAFGAKSMTEQAQLRSPVEAAAEAVKTYIRLNRERLAADGELLALLLPDRFRGAGVGDLQRHVIEKLRDDNAGLRAERDGLRGAREHAAQLGAAVQSAVLDLLDARTFEQAIAISVRAGAAFGAERVALCVEGGCSTPKGCAGVRMIAPGTAAALLGESSDVSVLVDGGAMLLGSAARDCRSVGVFRLRVSPKAPAALYVLGTREAGRFEGNEGAELAYFARALESSFRTWLDLPKS
jgi:uncharacterized protein YigA (DUF484 family)